MPDEKEILTPEPEGAEAEELYTKAKPEDDTLPEAEAKEGDEEAAEEELNLEELGLEANRSLAEQLKELNPKEVKVLKEKLSRLEATFPKLGYADLDHLIEAAEKFDPKAQPTRREKPTTKAETAAAKEFALGDWKSGFNEDSQKFAGLLAKDVLDYVRRELSKQEDDGRFEQIGEGIYSVADEQWYMNLLLKDMVAEREKALGVNRGRLKKTLNDYFTPEKLSEIRGRGENPYEYALKLLGNGSSPAAAVLKGGGIERATKIERPGATAGEAGTKLMKNPDGGIDWDGAIKKYGVDKVEAEYKKMFPQK